MMATRLQEGEDEPDGPENAQGLPDPDAEDSRKERDDAARRSQMQKAVCSYYSSHGRDQIATLRGMAGLHHRSMKTHIICLDFPARRKKFPVPDHREFVAITAERLVNLGPDSLRGA